MIHIDSGMINDFSKKFNENNTNLLAKNSISSNPLRNVLINQNILQTRRKIFSKKIDIENRKKDMQENENELRKN